MEAKIIRAGDPTSHGGYVLEGSQFDICMGKPIAFVGYLTFCPLCKGTFPIIEGSMTTTFYGKGVALAGMTTACGAYLVPTQSTDTVEWSRSLSTIPTTNDESSSRTVSQHSGEAGYSSGLSHDIESKFDLFFHVRNEKTGANLPNVPYKITLADGRELKGITDQAGHTDKVYSDHAQSATIEVPYYDDCRPDATDHSDPCCC